MYYEIRMTQLSSLRLTVILWARKNLINVKRVSRDERPKTRRSETRNAHFSSACTADCYTERTVLLKARYNILAGYRSEK